MTEEYSNIYAEVTPILKPCPFCGGKAKFVQLGSPYAHKVICTQCDVVSGGSAFKNDNYNASMWNRRFY